MKFFVKLTLAFGLLMAAAFGQVTVKHDMLVLQGGAVGANATIRVCDKAATGTPCTPLQTVYTDLTGNTTINQTTTPITADANGNYSIYTAPGTVKLQITFGNIVTTISDYEIPSIGAFGALSGSKFDNIRYVDGTVFGPDWAAGITAADSDCGANTCTIIVTNKAGLSSTVAPTVTWANGRCVYFDSGTFNLSVGWTISPVNDTNNVCLVGTPSTTLNFTGSAGFLIDGTGVGNGATVYLSSLLFNGNAGIINLVTFKKMARSRVEYLRSRNCTGAAILCQFCVNDLFIQPKVTVNEGGNYTTQPANGIVFDWITNSSNATDDVTVLSPETTGLSGDGIKIDHASEVRIVGGESNTNAIGLEIAGDHISTGTRNIVDGMHFEVNTVNDLKIDGFRNTLRDLTASASVGIDNLFIPDGNANDNIIIGGLYNRINVATNATRNSFYDVQYNGLGTGSFTNNGTNTSKLNVKNATSGVLDGNLNVGADTLSGFHAGNASTGKAMCWKDATHMGYCSSVVDAGGACTCN